MIYHFDKDIFKSNNRVDVFDEDDSLVCFCEGDFAYKNRKHFYDYQGNEFGYAQLELRNNIIHIYGKNDKPFGMIYINENILHANFVDWDIEINDTMIAYDSNHNEVMRIEEKEDKFEMNIKDNKDDLNSVICLFSLANYIAGE